MEKLNASPADVLMTDLKMLRMGGVELIEKLGAQEAGSAGPVWLQSESPPALGDRGVAAVAVSAVSRLSLCRLGKAI